MTEDEAALDRLKRMRETLTELVDLCKETIDAEGQTKLGRIFGLIGHKVFQWRKIVADEEQRRLLLKKEREVLI